MELTEQLCHMSICRLCAEENLNLTELFPSTENEQDLSKLVNKYLPLQITNDNKFPTKICPGCNIQLEATKLFMDLIVEGQSKLRNLYKIQQDKLHRQEKQRVQLQEALQAVNPTSTVNTYTIQSDETGDKFFIQIFSEGSLFPSDHELALQTEGLARPKRKRGRPPKLIPPVEDIDLAVNEKDSEVLAEPENIESTGSFSEDGKQRRRRKPTRFLEAIQGKELDKVFQQEGVIDEGAISDDNEDFKGESSTKVEEVIGRLENENGDDLGQPIVVNRMLHRPRSKIKSGHTKKRRKYQCDICGREFLHQGRCELHKKMHDVNYNCAQKDCNFQSNKRSILEEHQTETGHQDLFASEAVYQIGVLELPPGTEKTIPNEIDSLATNNLEDKLKKHYCETCKKQFTCKQNYEVHVKAVHDGERPFHCDHCGQRFSYASALKVHQLQHLRNKPNSENAVQYRCPSCPKAFKHPSSLQYHRDSVHTNGRRFVCNKCNKPFKQRQLLQRHQLVHSEDRPHHCSQCSASYKTRNSLMAHTLTVHVGQRSHWCNQCDKTFAHKTALKLHQQWHAGLRPHQCEFCKKSFSQKGNLAEHKRIHTGEKPYQCDNCGKAFTTSSQFKLHRKSHLNEKPHKCEYCLKSFVHKVTLRYHMRRHFNERPFKCQYANCDKTFLDVWSLRKHERLHTGERPYKCDMCTKAFADGSNLAKHKKTHKSFKDKQMLFVTYEKDSEDAIVTYIEPEEPILEDKDATEEMEIIGEENIKTIQLQQLIDQDGNPISFLTQDGQQVKVVTSNEDGGENIQGLLPDGTLVPISLTTIPDKGKPDSILIDEISEKSNDESIDDQLLSGNIHLLTTDDVNKAAQNNIQFVTEDTQNNMCLVTTYNIEDTINPQYLNLA